MEVLNQLLSTYASFFDWSMWKEVLTDPVSWGYIGTLIVLEGLLSADNALVLAVMVKHLPKEQQKKALTYGLIGAYFFRFLFIGLGMWLIKFWWIKVLGAAYLAYLVIKQFWLKTPEEDIDGVKKDGWMIRTFGVFWGTVISVELMDLAFSVDSILAAFAVSDKVWILLIGGMLGILMMRTVAKLFLVLIDKIPELETTAFILIGIIAIKMLLSVFHIEIGHLLFFSIIIAAFVITFFVHIYHNKQGGHDHVA
ncbi:MULTISPECIES: TerC family protein [Cytobacillus]|uniref:TerC family protein n=1 Tax=Cytobacillus TaxID=2675230 RepID=UPI001CD20BB5|nr:TerC family protein [Cytobacillus kochii]MCA1028239.1 TerC family protein [Cytobacillus kochii]MCM3321076.1 TerC family protein [Cytobacillus kochii]MCM3344091.1 TerC family protein [Cytobacillus kochii]MDM5207936.1 TerC family protein [Cytobacillus kochii]